MAESTIIQKYVRGFLYRSHLPIGSKFQTKIWRKESSWYDNGKRNECENFQYRLITEITKFPIEKTHMRFNMNTISMEKIVMPMKFVNGFDYTENFDGMQQRGDTIIYYNLKMICDKGGSQTRSLREVYHFIQMQLKYLQNSKRTDVYFVNILDGDECYRNKSKFIYLLSKKEYDDIKKYIFMGDMRYFSIWYNYRESIFT
jgi:hypothetical protein